MQIGQDKSGMITMNQSLRNAVEKGLIDTDTALSYSTASEELMNMLGLKGKNSK